MGPEIAWQRPNKKMECQSYWLLITWCQLNFDPIYLDIDGTAAVCASACECVCVHYALTNALSSPFNIWSFPNRWHYFSAIAQYQFSMALIWSHWMGLHLVDLHNKLNVYPTESLPTKPNHINSKRIGSKRIVWQFVQLIFTLRRTRFWIIFWSDFVWRTRVDVRYLWLRNAKTSWLLLEFHSVRMNQEIWI